MIERMVDVAAAQLKMDPAELRRKNYIPPEAMPFKTEPHLHLRLRRVREGHGPGAEDGRRATASPSARRNRKKHGKLRGLGMSNTIERAAAPSFEGAEIRFDRGGTVQIFSGSHQPGPGPRDHVQAGGRRQARRRIPTTSSTSRATPTRCSSAKAPAARARPPCRGSAFHMRRRKGHRQGEGDRRAQPQGRCRRHQIRRRPLLQHQDQPDHDHQGRGAGLRSIRPSCRRTWRPACTPPRSTRRTSRTSRTACTSARSRSIRRPARSRWCATTWSTTSAP